MISRLIQFEWKQFFRSSYWQKSIALNILMVVLGLYFIVIFLALGISLFPILKEQFPHENPLYKINDFIFFWILADMMMRFFLQKLPVLSVKSFLTLPLKKAKIVHYVLGKSVLSFFNLLPLFAIIPFSLISISEGVNPKGVFTWMALMMIVTLIVNFLNFILESLSAESDWSFLPIIVLVGGLFALNHFNIISFSSLISNAYKAIIDNSILLIIPLILLGMLYFLNFKSLKNKLYLDVSLKTKSNEVQTSDMSWTRKLGSIAPFLQLDLKMIWRNKRPRSSVFILIIGLLYGLFFYPNPVYKEMIPMFVFVAIFITGIFLISFGQFIPAWDSAHYKLLMSQNIPYKDYLKSKFALMQWSAVILFVLSIPYVYFGWKILLLHFAAAIYNIGINTYVLLYAGSFNRKKIDLNQRAAFNYQGTGAVQWIVGFPLILIPVLIFYIPYKFINFESGVATLIIMGLLGIIFHHKLMNFITLQYKESKYKMISAFGQSE